MATKVIYFKKMFPTALLFNFVVFIFFETNLAINCTEEGIRFCQCKEDGHRYVVDCCDVGLKSVPKNIPIQTTHLFLDDNNLKILQNESFNQENRGLPHLVMLSIKKSKLEKIEPDTFRWLPNLKELNLNNNSLEQENSLPNSVFQPLNKSLNLLDIRINLMDPNIDLVNYPKAVAELHNLEELRMDCLTNKSLPVEYSSLKHLQTMTFGGGRRNIRIIHEEMFAAILKLNVTKIDLTSLFISMIWEKTFSGLRYLNWLDLSNNPHLCLSMKIFAASLNETSVTKLNLNNTGIGTASSSPSTLLRFFCHLPLKELTLDHNSINHVDPIFKECFSSLEVLSFGDNYLYFSHEFVDDTLFGLPNLVGFNFTWQRQSNSVTTTGHGHLQKVFRKRPIGKLILCKNDLSINTSTHITMG